MHANPGRLPHWSSATLAALLCSTACQVGFSPLGDDELGSGSDGEAQTTDSESETSTQGSESDTGPETPPAYELDAEDMIEIDAVAGELAAIVAGSLAHFDLEQPGPPLHACPHPDGALSGESGWTPSLALDCNEAPDRKCLPIFAGGGVGQYDMGLWTQNQVWIEVGWSKPELVGHKFHYELTVTNDLDGFGACSLTASASADFDGDGVFSLYSLSATVDEQGAMIGELVVEDGLE